MNNNILMYENNPINSKLMKMFLEQAGYIVYDALNIEQFEQQNLLNKYCISFLDTTLPNLNKTDLTHLIKKLKQSERCNASIVATMNNTSEDEINFFMNIGMDGYITKPITVKSLKHIVETLSSGKVLSAPCDEDMQISSLSRSIGVKNEDKIRELFNAFFETTKENLNNISMLAKNKRFIELRPIVQNIKNAAKNLKLTQISKIAEDIENQTKYPSATLNIDNQIFSLKVVTNRAHNKFIERNKGN